MLVCTIGHFFETFAAGVIVGIFGIPLVLFLVGGLGKLYYKWKRNK